ncbi:MAG: RNA polymerase sigma factor [Actinomycetota bacterium]
MKLPPFQRFVETHWEDVSRFLRATIGRSDAEDCLQETFLAALRSYPRLRNDDNLRGWVLTIAHRKVLDAHRDRGRRAFPVAEIPDRAAPEPPEANPGVWEAVESLPPKQRAAVALRYVLDLSHREIARIMGGSEEAARSNVHEGVKRLRKEKG